MRPSSTASRKPTASSRRVVPDTPPPPPPEITAFQAVQRSEYTEWVIPLVLVGLGLILAWLPMLMVSDRVWYLDLPGLITGWIVIPGWESWIGREMAVRLTATVLVAIWSLVWWLTAWGCDRRVTNTYRILHEAVSASWQMIEILVPRTVSYSIDVTDRLNAQLLQRIRPRSPALPSFMIGWYVRIPGMVSPVIMVLEDGKDAVREQIRSLPGNATIQPRDEQPWVATDSDPWVVWMTIRVTGDPGTPPAGDAESPAVIETVVSSLALLSQGEALLACLVAQPRSRYAETSLSAAIRTARDADPKNRVIDQRAQTGVPIHLRIIGVLRFPASMTIDAVRTEVAGFRDRLHAIQLDGGTRSHRILVESYRIIRPPRATTDPESSSAPTAPSSAPTATGADIVDIPPVPAGIDGRWSRWIAVGVGVWMGIMPVATWMAPEWYGWWLGSSVASGGGWLTWTMIRRTRLYRWYDSRYHTAWCFAPPDEDRFPWWVPRYHDRW